MIKINPIEVTFIQYEKDLVSDQIKKNRHKFRFLLIVTAICAAVCVFGALELLKSLWAGLLILISAAFIVALCLIKMFSVRHYLSDKKNETLTYDDKQLVYRYGNGKSIVMPYNKIKHIEMIRKNRCFVVQGSFQKMEGESKSGSCRTVIIYDYFWDFKMIMFKKAHININSF